MNRRLWLAWSIMTAAPAIAGHGRVQRTDLGVTGWPVGEFTLTDDRGRAFTLENLRGRWTFVLFGDTQCIEACAAPLAALAALRRRIARTEALKTTQVVFVSTDAGHDGAEGLRAYLRRFDDSFIGATGSAGTLRSLADDLGVGGARGDARGSMALIGPDGSVRVQYLPPFDVPLLTAHYLKTRVRP